MKKERFFLLHLIFNDGKSLYLPMLTQYTLLYQLHCIANCTDIKTYFVYELQVHSRYNAYTIK